MKKQQLMIRMIMALLLFFGVQTTINSKSVMDVNARNSRYPNVLAEAGYSQQEIDQRINEVCEQLFRGPQRIYFEVGDSMGYISDVKNHDVRTEGMSYGLMIAVQLNDRDMFDRLWRWSRTYMQHHEGKWTGYFAWSCNIDGTKRAQGPASDGELYFVTSLLFANNRWGKDLHDIDYLAEAQYILKHATSKGEADLPVTNLINPENRLITFVPSKGGDSYTDPSYHLPAFYEVWARWANDGKANYWRSCAQASRAYLHKAIHPETGLNPDYSDYDGQPFGRWGIIGKAFRYDSWRVPMNITLDSNWSGADREWQTEYANRIQAFFYKQGLETFGDQFEVDGTTPERLLQAGDQYPPRLRHSLGLVATLAAASIISTNEHRLEFVRHFWESKHEPYDDGFFDAYYDGLLQLFAYLHLSGRYRVIEEQPLLRTHVETGDVEGVLDGNDLAVYKAIPYAAPPVGDLRWKDPQPAKAWEGVLKADKFGPWPPQPTRPGLTEEMMSEDCLYLGIATPAKSACEKLPVMVWIHGGGFQTEHYGGDLWTSLARRGVVIVSIEYRTGALGFMAHPELAKESAGGHTGNYGLLDQIYALQWIQRNIANFGGDPSKVTIFGESAGAISCSILCGSPLAKGLFRAAISQSGGSFAPWTDADRTIVANASQKASEQHGLAFQKHLKKKSLKQMRQIPAQQLCGGNVGFGGFWPCVDGYVITDDLYRNYERGDYNDVPVIVMTNSDEGAMISGHMQPTEEIAEAIRKQMQVMFGDFYDEAVKLYPVGTPQEAVRVNGDFFRDLGFAWPSFAWASLQNKNHKQPAYAAFLAQPSEVSLTAAGVKDRGVSHADDILYLNGTFTSQAEKYPTEAAVAEIIQQYWVNFAKTGTPNAKGLPYWPKFDPAKPTTMQFCNGASLICVPNRPQIDFLDRFFKSKREQLEAERK